MITLAPISTEPTEAELVELFQIDDVVYTVPAKPKVNVSLQLLRDSRRHGPEMAQLMLLEKLLGIEAYDALCDYEALTTENLKEISQAAAKLTLGALEDSSGNSEPASEKSAG